MINYIFRGIDALTPFVTLYVSLSLAYLSRSSGEPYFEIALIASLLMVFINEIRGAYKQTRSSRVLCRHLEITFESWGFVVLAIITYLYLSGGSHMASRRALFLWLFLTPILIFAIKYIAHKVSIKNSPVIKLLSLGQKLELNNLESARIKESRTEILHAVSALDVNKLDKIDSIIFNYEQAPSMEEIKCLTHLELSGVKLISSNEFYERYLRKCHIPYTLESIEFMNDIRKPTQSSKFLKQLIDVVMVSSLFVIALPLLLVTTLMVRRESPGSLFFIQSRVGEMMKSFRVVKFRSMHENSKFDPYTQEQDARVFPYGNFMRKARIDEIPQIWNILKGDMHFIGPRAEWDVLVENYERDIPYYHERHLVKPGITGWAQVMYPYGSNIEDARQKLMYDLYYIKHWSLWLELETIIRTIGVVLSRKGL